jgi:hypothetical protein
MLDIPKSKDRFNPEEFKNLAMYLKENKNSIHNPDKISTECINRVIAGRLYYSIFLTLRELIINELSNYSNCPREIKYFKDALLRGSVHNTLLRFIEKLRDDNNLKQNHDLNMAIRQIYNSLEFLKGHRVAADYDLSIPTPVKTNRSEVKINFENDITVAKLERKYHLIINSLDKLEEILKRDKNGVCNILRDLLREL